MYIKLNGKQAVLLKAIMSRQMDDIQDMTGDYEFLEDDETELKTINKVANCVIDIYEQLDGVEEKELPEIIEMFEE